MATYEITTPDGATYEVTTPDAARPTVGDVVSGGVQNLGNALTAGFMDEASAGVNTGIDALGALVTGKAGVRDVHNQAGGIYDEYLNKARGQRNTFREAAGPTLAYGQDLGAMLLMPKGLFGSPKTVGQVAKTGAEVGALYGFGEGEGGLADRAMSAGIGAGAGATIGAGLGLAGKGLGKAAETQFGQAVIQELKRLAADQSGAIGSRAAVAGELTPVQVQLLERIRSAEPAKITAAISRLAKAQAEGVPLTLTEALEMPSVTRQARALANFEPSMERVGEFITQRSSTAPERVSEIMNVIGPSEPAAVGGGKLRAGAEEVVDAITQQRGEVVRPLFEAAEKVRGEGFEMPRESYSKEIQRLLKSDILQPMVKGSREIIAAQKNIPTESVNPNSVEVIQDVLERLGQKIKTADRSASPDSPRVKRDWTVIKNKLEGLVKENEPQLYEARKTYAEISNALKNPTDQQLRVLTSIKDMQLEKAGESLMQMPAQQISKLRTAFEDAGQEESFKAGVRSYFQGLLEKSSGDLSRNNDLANKLLPNAQMQQRLEAALGGDEARVILERLAQERLIHKGTQALHPGSSTAGNLAEERALTQSKNMLGKVFSAVMQPRQTLMTAVDRATTSQLDDVLANELAKTYITEPGRGLSDLIAIQELQAKRFPTIQDAARLEALLQQYNSRFAGVARGPTNGNGSGGNGSNGSGAGSYSPGLEVSPKVESQSQPKGGLSLPGSRGNGTGGGTKYQASALVPLGLFTASANTPGEGKSQAKSSLFKPGGSNAGINTLFGAVAKSGAKKNGGDMKLEYLPRAKELRNAIIKQESSGRADAIGPDTDGDTKTLADNAKGLMQLMDPTGKEWHAKLGLSGKYDPFDKEQNKTIGTAYMAWLLEQFKGDEKLALAAYNYGIGNVKNKMAKWGKSFKSIYPRLPLETQQYVMRISKNAGIA